MTKYEELVRERAAVIEAGSSHIPSLRRIVRCSVRWDTISALLSPVPVLGEKANKRYKYWNSWYDGYLLVIERQEEELGLKEKQRKLNDDLD